MTSERKLGSSEQSCEKEQKSQEEKSSKERERKDGGRETI